MAFAALVILLAAMKSTDVEKIQNALISTAGVNEKRHCLVIKPITIADNTPRINAIDTADQPTYFDKTPEKLHIIAAARIYNGPYNFLTGFCFSELTFICVSITSILSTTSAYHLRQTSNQVKVVVFSTLHALYYIPANK